MQDVRTFSTFYVLVEFGRHPRDSLIKCVLLQLSREFSFVGVGPGTGDVSGYCSIYLLRLTWKLSSMLILIMSVVKH